ncbi:unnamed protein product [Ceratitis capitata]|uniref:(Mediterranean fruit fly) hypothetical protein n=1 Tax=Ceratitis capitata TaxID=7213 RepID=A0A811VA15_CERCA|nr:unnamed protein product [Ceratitis capitata]
MKDTMLDGVREPNTMLTTFDATAALAAAKPAIEDKNKSPYITTITNSSPSKAKTLFSWFRGGNTKSDSKPDNNTATLPSEQNQIDSGNSRVERKEVHLGNRDKSSSTETQPPATERDVTLRDFPGVQSLRHLWNKRISASEDATRRQGTLKDSKAGKLTKSIGCLVHAANASPTDTPLSAEEGSPLQQKRAHSLHDCTNVGVCTEASPTAATFESEFDCLHREKDNFYKYKTAEQAAKHLTREARMRIRSARRVTAGIVSSQTCDDDAHFPAVKASDRGERIHWLKRQDMVTRRRDGVEMASAKSRIGHETAIALSADAIVINENANNATKAKTTTIMPTTPTSSAPQYTHLSDYSDNETLTASSSPRYSVSRKRNASEATNTSVTKRSSSDSNKSNSLSTSSSIRSGALTGGRSARRTASGASGSASARKYSFKTHARTYHAPRKMSQRDSTTAGSGSGVGGSGIVSASTLAPGGGNIVAKLTQQFNEMIQKDKKLLEEVKRNNGVLMSRGGHVYKVLQNPDAAGEADKRSAASLSRYGTRGSTVQRNIMKFECGADAAKPAVPAKSAQVLQKLRELNKTQKYSLTNGGTVGGVSKNLKLHITPSTHHDLQSKLDLKKAQMSLPLSPPLEVVTEESKTPLEAYEKSIAISAQVEAPRVDVPSAHNEESTYGQHTNDSNSNNGIVDNTKTFNEFELKTTDDLKRSANRTTAINEGFNSGSVPTPLTTNCADARGDKKSSETQIKNENGVATDVKSNAIICIESFQLPAEPLNVEVIEAPTRATTNAERSIPTAMLTLDVAHNVENCKNVTATIAKATTTTTVKAETTQSPIGERASDDQLDAVNDEKAKQRKHKYAKIYEKFRFRSPFVGGHNNKKLSPKPPTTGVGMCDEMIRRPESEHVDAAAANIKPTKTKSSTPTPPATPILKNISPVTDEINEVNGTLDTTHAAIATLEPASKLLDALEIIDNKLKDLAVDDVVNDINTKALLLSPDDDFEQRVLPNNSFIFQASTKQVANNKLIVAQAVNISLVNSIQGEQLIMEQKELQRQQIDYSELMRPPSMKMEQPFLVEIVSGKAAAPVEPMYEPIAAQTEITKTEGDSTTEATTALQIPPKSFLYNSLAMNSDTKKSETSKALEGLPETTESTTELFEDIYQTVDEAKATAAAALAEATNAALLADYESIAGSCEHTTPATLTASQNVSKPLYDGYEICEPPPDIPPALPTATVPTAEGTGVKLMQQISAGGGNVRNTNDELPELPKPKRRLPKSPMPGKRSPKAATKNTAELREHNKIASNRSDSNKSGSNSTITATDLQDDEHHYYADDENIYDTIKGSHCYESVHAASHVTHRSSNAASKCVSDSISLSSNCYESISHYRRVSNGTVVVGHLTGSSSGSTLTISSDHKTNSLYEMSVTTASMIYGNGSLGSYGQSSGAEKSSASVAGRIGATKPNAGDENSDGVAGAKTYSQSHCGATSDNSDEWVDISDPEAEGTEQFVKPQFIVVRERSKVHRSPDWSKRVRDKRLHQKKAISCIEGRCDYNIIVYGEGEVSVENEKGESNKLLKTYIQA